jgi:hypothetical protein
MYVDLDSTNVQLECTTLVDLEISPAESVIRYLSHFRRLRSLGFFLP